MVCDKTVYESLLVNASSALRVDAALDREDDPIPVAKPRIMCKRCAQPRKVCLGGCTARRHVW